MSKQNKEQYISFHDLHPNPKVDECGNSIYYLNTAKTIKYIKFYNGAEAWYLNNELHREGAAAFISSEGAQIWVKNGKYHREDGPAIEYTNSAAKYWYYNDCHIRCQNQQEFEKMIKLKAFWE